MAIEKVCLTIAGSDSGGGAGIQGDLKTFEALGVFGTAVITAVTAQNTARVYSVHKVPADSILSQLSAVMEDMRPAAIKIGMLPDIEVAKALISFFRARWEQMEDKPLIVLDPVLVATCGDLLSDVSTSVFSELAPFVTVVTPNIPEALVLSGMVVSPEKGGSEISEMVRKVDLAAMDAMGKSLSGIWKAVLLKGGHLEGTGDVCVDRLYAKGRAIAEWTCPKLRTRCTHGTGCALSSAIAASLSLGRGLEESVSAARNYVFGAISYGLESVGTGCQGPLFHSWNRLERAVPRPTLNNPTPFTTLAVEYAGQTWHEYVNHPVCRAIADGVIDIAQFKRYLQQDLVYLGHYLRVHALLIYKQRRPTPQSLVSSLRIIADILAEMRHHRERFHRRTQLELEEKTFDNARSDHGSNENVVPTEKGDGTTAQAIAHRVSDLKRTESVDEPPEEESLVTTAYSRYLLDVASTGSELELRVATYSCLYGYGVMGKQMFERAVRQRTLGTGIVDEWLATYSGGEYWQAVKVAQQELEQMIQDSPPSMRDLVELLQIFKQTTKYEIEFFNQAS